MSWRTSGYRTKARRLAHNNREYILMSRQQHGDCTFCGRHDGENMHGSLSQWGKKRAMKRFYSTGKTRSLPKRFGGRSWYLELGILVYPGEYEKQAQAHRDSDWQTYDYCLWCQKEREKLGKRALNDPKTRKYA